MILVGAEQEPHPLTLEDAHAKGWRALRVVLAEVRHLVPHDLKLDRTFMLWRHARLVPSSIRPLRGWLDGKRIALWPPETERFLRDALTLRPLVSMKGRRRARGQQIGSAPHAGLRVALWIKCWHYDDALVRESLLSSLPTVSTRGGQGINLLQLLADLFSDENAPVPPQKTVFPKALRRDVPSKSEQMILPRIAHLGRLSIRSLQRAVREASRDDLQAVRQEVEGLLEIALHAISGKPDTFSAQEPGPKGLLFDLLAIFAVGMIGMKLRPASYRDILRNLGVIVGWRLTERRKEKAERIT